MIACLLAVGLESDPHHVMLETLKWYILMLCLACDTNNESMENALANKQA